MSDPVETRTAVVGRKPVLQALADAEMTIDTVYIKRDLKSPIVPKIRKACKARGVSLKFVPPEKLDRLAGRAVHQGIVALTSDIAMVDLDTMLEEIAPTWEDTKRLKPLLLIPDRISDPHNLGAIVRSAAAFGCNGIILPERHAAPLGGAAIKASAGTALNTRFAKVVNVAQTIRQLKERGYWVAGLTGKGNVPLSSVDWDRPIVLVVGSEAEGLRALVEQECDLLVSIPMAPEVESLNAAVAAGIVLHAAASTRLGGGSDRID